MDPIHSAKFPLWSRIAIVAIIVAILGAAGLFSWRWFARPTTLTVAVGSLDGEAVK